MTLPDPVALAIPAFIALILVEMLVWKMGGRARYETRDAAASLVMGLGNFITGLLGAVVILSAFTAVHRFRLFDLGYQPWVFVACFFAEDLAYYWFHRVSHERRWFWASHVVHHSSQHYNLTTALRQTWTGWLTGAFVFWLPLPLIGFPPPMVVFFQGLSLVYQFWIHTETIGRLGPLEWVLNTPSHHRVHHATNPRYLDRNYAGVLIIWDRIFGTFEPEREDERPRYGIIKNLATFNPLAIAFQEWVGLVRDLAAARSLKDAVRFIAGAPGWSPDGSRKTSASIRARWLASRPRA